MEIVVSSLYEGFLVAYNEVMWNHRIVETEDGELTYEGDLLTVIVNFPNDDKDLLKLGTPYKDNFMKTYEQEILYGSEADFDYTYNERLFGYGGSVNQVEYVIGKLAKDYQSRRAVAITWYPEQDTSGEFSVPCLQYIQCHIVNKKVDMITLWRSRDVLMGMPANIYAINTLHNHVVEQLRQKGMNVEIGCYVDISVVPHIYFKRDDNYIRAMN